MYVAIYASPSETARYVHIIRMAFVVSFLRTSMFRYAGLPNIIPVDCLVITTHVVISKY